MPATIIVAGGLVHPPPWCGQRFSAMEQRVKGTTLKKCMYFFTNLHVDGLCSQCLQFSDEFTHELFC